MKCIREGPGSVFGQFFDPYISLGLEQYGIPSNSCSIDDVFVHSSTFNVVSYASCSIMCPTFFIVSYISDCQMTLISNFVDAMFFGFEVGEGIEFDSLVRDLILKIWFLDLDEKEVDNVIKGGRRVSKLGPRMHLMNGESFPALIKQDQLLIF
jgi:hypothetical protein